jgi:hypothetical protein
MEYLAPLPVLFGTSTEVVCVWHGFDLFHLPSDLYRYGSNTWVYQKVPRLSSTDRKQMALGEYLRYD